MTTRQSYNVKEAMYTLTFIHVVFFICQLSQLTAISGFVIVIVVLMILKEWQMFVGFHRSMQTALNTSLDHHHSHNPIIIVSLAKGSILHPCSTLISRTRDPSFTILGDRFFLGKSSCKNYYKIKQRSVQFFRMPRDPGLVVSRRCRSYQESFMVDF